MADSRGNRRSGQQGSRRTRRGGSAVDPARAAAYDVLERVRVQDAYTNLVLPHVLRSREITGRDAAFVTELVSGAIRRQGTYDAVLSTCVDRPLTKVDPVVRDALRLGAHQLLSMRVPAHAAISTSVDLVRDRSGRGAAGFANAVLRKVAEHDLDDWVRRIAPHDPIGFASLAHAHPAWIVAELSTALAGDAGAQVDPAELDALLVADNAAPRVTLAARPGRSSPDELGGQPTGRSPWAVMLEAGDPGEIPAVAEGRAGVQDEGSQLVTLALAAAPVEGRDEQWLDACAGPGGKAALLAALASHAGARVLAAERQPHRAGLVQRATAGVRAGLSGLVVADSTRPAWRSGWFDRVLVDAPCSGLGALRRRPEARWRRSPRDISDLVPLQRELLEQALDSVRPGGVVGYVTCSPVLAETRGVVEAVLAARENAHLEDAASVLQGIEGVHVADLAGPLEGTVQLWPHRHGTDAMFLALVRRR